MTEDRDPVESVEILDDEDEPQPPDNDPVPTEGDDQQ